MKLRISALGGALALFGLVACTPSYHVTPGAPSTVQSTPTTAATPVKSPFPPRPAELQMDELDACTLLTDSQQTQLGVQVGMRANDADEFQSSNCIWDNNLGVPSNSWLGRTVSKQGADFYLASTTPTQIVQVAGFSAVESSSPYFSAEKHCILFIDVAAGQHLRIMYENSQGDYPGINHAVACKQATRAAELMLQNLRARTH